MCNIVSSKFKKKVGSTEQYNIVSKSSRNVFVLTWVFIAVDSNFDEVATIKTGVKIQPNRPSKMPSVLSCRINGISQLVSQYVFKVNRVVHFKSVR